MTIHLDTSIVIEALSTAGPNLLRPPSVRGDKLIVSTLVLYEWLRRPRSPEQLDVMEGLFPAERIIPFGRDEARAAGRLYQHVKRARTREVDIAIAACAVEHGASLWTLNPKDFEDIPGLTLYYA